MAYSTDDFIQKVVGISVGVIVTTAIAIPLISQATADMTAGPTKTILDILPVFIVIGILMAAVYWFISKRRE